MKNIKYNRLVFGKKEKDNSVHTKFKTFTKRHLSKSNPGMKFEEPQKKDSSYDKWLVECGLRPPKPVASNPNLNQDLVMFVPDSGPPRREFR